jgi:thiazole synthase
MDSGQTNQSEPAEDWLEIGGRRFRSRFILGSGKFSLETTRAALESGGVEMVTLAVRRTNVGGEENILDYLPASVTLLPNTSGARSAEEALRLARLARGIGCGDFIKVEVIRDTKYLLPDNHETARATELLVRDGFIALPYMYPDLNSARDMAQAGAAAIMPLGAPIGSNQGLLTKEFIRILVEEIDLPVIVDAGLGRPSQACEAMEIGAAAIMANTAIATAGDAVLMARSFKLAVEAGRLAWLAGPGRVLERRAEASSPLTGFLR